MEKIVYERHTHKHYKDKTIPFIFHRDHLMSYISYDSRLHWHENLEFLCCISGKGEVITEANRLPFEMGDVISINTNSPHSFSAFAGGNLDYYCIIVDTGFCRENGINIEQLQFSPRTVDETARSLYTDAFEACEASGDFHGLAARTKVLDFLLYMCQNHLEKKENAVVLSSMEEIKKVVSFVRNNYYETISLEDAAGIAGFSVYYFSREFKKVTGQTFVTFLNTVRCEKAARMLREGASVTRTCYACGFKELSYFSRTFSRIIGMAPSRITKDE